MKKLFLSCSLFLVSLISQAQFNRGTIVLGGDLGLATSSDKVTSAGFTSPKTTSTDIYVRPSIGLAVQKDLVLGVNLGLGYLTQPGQKENSYDFGVFMRKYKDLAGRLYFFGETGLLFDYSDYILDNAGGSPSRQETKASDIVMGFTPGIAYLLNRRWQLEVAFPSVISARYTHDQTSSLYPSQGVPPLQTESRNVSNEFSFNTSLTNSFQLDVGLRYLIGK
jgi:hypothetical protein